MSKEKGISAPRRATSRGSGNRKAIITLERLKHEDRERALDEFATALREYLAFQEHSEMGVRPDTRDKVMALVNKALGYTAKNGFDVRQFDNLMKALFQDGNFRIATRTLAIREKEIMQRFNGLQATVCAGTSRRSFARVATVEVLRLMSSIGKHKTEIGKPLYIGLVSGSTTKTVIDELCASDDWLKDFGVEPTSFPEVVVFALNVSFTRPEYLPSHAMILAQALADAINKAAKKEKAKAYGLNAELIVEGKRLEEVDKMPQTRDVLAFTEPYRVGRSTEENHTELDIVLTGVGQWNHNTPRSGVGQPAGSNSSPSATEGNDARSSALPENWDGIVAACSIFQNLLRGFSNLNYDLFRQHHVVGDLGFTPLEADGRKVDLHGVDKNEKATDYFVYSAARLSILDAMVSTENKAVVLVAQSTQEKNKTPILYASLAGSRAHDPQLRGHVSHLIIDEHTAQELIHYSSTSLP